MSFLDKITTSDDKDHKLRVVLYGTKGIGKTTYAAATPNPVFILTEDGLGLNKVPAFPLAKTYLDVREYVNDLIKGEHPYKTLVIDSLDWLERLIQTQVAQEEGKKDIAEIPFGKGHALAAKYMHDLAMLLDTLREKRGMNILLLAHSQIKRFESPDTDPYDRYQLDLHQKAAAVIEEWADVILFYNYRVQVQRNKDGDARAIGAGLRVMFAQERPAHLAKNRYGLDLEVPYNWKDLVSKINNNIGGKNGTTVA